MKLKALSSLPFISAGCDIGKLAPLLQLYYKKLCIFSEILSCGSPLNVDGKYLSYAYSDTKFCLFRMHNQRSMHHEPEKSHGDLIHV